jgi:hypothetical protein
MKESNLNRGRKMRERGKMKNADNSYKTNMKKKELYSEKLLMRL